MACQMACQPSNLQPKEYINPNILEIDMICQDASLLTILIRMSTIVTVIKNLYFLKNTQTRIILWIFKLFKIIIASLWPAIL